MSESFLTTQKLIIIEGSHRADLLFNGIVRLQKEILQKLIITSNLYFAKFTCLLASSHSYPQFITCSQLILPLYYTKCVACIFAV